MSEIKYLEFSQVNPDALLPVLNEESLRKHLIDHDQFDSDSVRGWMNDKLQSESIPGCYIRAVFIDDELAGWCGIQPDENGFEVAGFEIAIVISQKFWGFGKPIFVHLMSLAKKMGHTEIVFHLLDSRPEYRALKRMATKVQPTELLGRRFTTYFISVTDWNN